MTTDFVVEIVDQDLKDAEGRQVDSVMTTSRGQQLVQIRRGLDRERCVQALASHMARYRDTGPRSSDGPGNDLTAKYNRSVSSHLACARSCISSYDDNELKS